MEKYLSINSTSVVSLLLNTVDYSVNKLKEITRKSKSRNKGRVSNILDNVFYCFSLIYMCI